MGHRSGAVRVRIGLAGLGLGIWLAASIPGAAQPLAVHPANPHYFLWKGKAEVLITSGEHYGAVINRDFDFKTYLRTLQKDGLNNTRLFTGSYYEPYGAFGISFNTLGPKPDRYIGPWKRTGAKFDLTQWNDEYFARLREFMDEAERAGVIVELNLFCPFYKDEMWAISPMNAVNNVNGVGNVGRRDVYALKNDALTGVQDELTRKFVTELNGYDNLYFEICNEPYFEGVTLEWQSHIAKVIRDAEAGLPKKHLISQNWANGSTRIDKPDPLVSFYNFHYSRPPRSVAVNWNLNCPIGNNETGFDGTADAHYRIQGWDFLLAGGALYNNLDYSFAVGFENGTFRYSANDPGGGGVALRQQLGVVKRVLGSLELERMKPLDSVVTAKIELGTVRVLGDPGRAYLLYVHFGMKPEAKGAKYRVSTANQKLRLEAALPEGAYRIDWIEPRSGQTLRRDDLEVRSKIAWLNTPVFKEDIAARIVSVR